MYKIALKMLIEEKAKFIGMVLSLSFSALIITQQMSVFIGIMRRSYVTIADTPQADIWVMDPNVQMIDDIMPLRGIDLYRVRCIEGVAWAVPFFKGNVRARLFNGQFQTCNLLGVDDSSLIGSPHTMLEGNVEDLRKPDAIIVNKIGAHDKLGRTVGRGLPKIPLKIGDVIELNDRRAIVIGICDVSRPFHSQPVVYTTYKRALHYVPFERKQLSFILVKSDGRMPIAQLCKKITTKTHFAAYSKADFEQLTVDYYLRNTGIPINFGFAVILGILVGAAIAGQIFYNFVMDNLRYLALFAVMGASSILLARMTLLQAIWVATIGWGLGAGCAAMIGFLSRKTELAFHLTWEVFFGVGIIIFIICIVALLISIARIFKIELWTMFK